MMRTQHAHRTSRWTAALVVAALAVAACGGDDDGATPATTAADAAGGDGDGSGVTAPAEPGGTEPDAPDVDGTEPDAPATTTEPLPSGELDLEATLRYGTTNPLQSLDPHVAASPSTGIMPFLEPVYDRLVGLGPELTLEPMLATGWEYSDDGLTLTFTLRDDAVFSDGEPLTADAVKRTMERLLTVEGAPEALELNSVDSIDVVDDLTVAFNLNRPAAELPYVMASAVGIVVSPNAIDSPDLAENPVGIGPYVVSNYVAGDRVVYERNPDYWNPGVQNFASLEIVVVVDDNARLNGLRSGELDVVYVSAAQIQEAEALADSGDFGLHTAPAWGYEYIWLNLDAVPDPTARQAMFHAIDRASISEALFAGDCAATTQPRGPGQIGHVPELEERFAYDPDRARAMLSEVEGPVTLELLGLASSPNRELAVAVQDQLEAVGFDVNVTSGDSAAQFGAFAQGNGDGIVISESSSFFQGAVLTSHFKALARVGAHGSEELLALDQQVYDATLSDDERADIIERINRLWVEETLSVPICRQGIKTAYGADVVGVEDMRFPISRRVHDVRHLGKLAS